MRQLQLFTTAQLAKMRDRTAARNYSVESEEFRRNHERHRAWGLERRHAERLRQLREKRRAALEPAGPAPGPPPARSASGPASGSPPGRSAPGLDAGSQSGRPASGRVSGSRPARPASSLDSGPPPGRSASGRVSGSPLARPACGLDSKPPPGRSASGSASGRLPTRSVAGRRSGVSAAAVPGATGDNRRQVTPASARSGASLAARPTRAEVQPGRGLQISAGPTPPPAPRAPVPPRPARSDPPRPDPTPTTAGPSFPGADSSKAEWHPRSPRQEWLDRPQRSAHAAPIHIQARAAAITNLRSIRLWQEADAVSLAGFPEGFVVGVATANYQIKGAAPLGAKLPSPHSSGCLRGGIPHQEEARDRRSSMARCAHSSQRTIACTSGPSTPARSIAVLHT